MDRQEKKAAKRRAKQRKAESREGQQQGETSIGEEAVPEVAGKAAGRWRDLRRRAEANARTRLVWDLWRVSCERRGLLGMCGGLLVSRQQKSAVALWRMHRAEEKSRS